MTNYSQSRLMRCVVKSPRRRCLSPLNVSLFLLLSGQLLAGCANYAGQAVFLYPPPILDVPNDPTPPPDDASSDEVGEYIINLWNSYEQCRIRMEAIRKWVRENQ